LSTRMSAFAGCGHATAMAPSVDQIRH